MNKKEEEVQKSAVFFTSEELDRAEKEMNSFDDEQSWLVAKGAIRIDDDGVRYVRINEDGTVPINECNLIYEAVQKRARGRAYGESKRIFALTGEYPVYEPFEKFKEVVKDILKTKKV